MALKIIANVYFNNKQRITNNSVRSDVVAAFKRQRNMH